MIGFLLIHGFTGSPNEVDPLRRLLEHQGYPVIAPVLKGHEGPRKQLKHVTWKDWIESAEQGLRDLMFVHQRIIIIGFSMGGLIAAHLATKYPVERLILLSPAIFAPNYQQILQDIRENIRMRKGLIHSRLLEYAHKICTTPIRTFWHYRLLVRHLCNDLPNVRVPTLIIHGSRDDVVHPRSAKYIFHAIASNEKKLYFLPRSKHIICHDKEAEHVKSLVTAFLPQY